ncbi:hypothetical protein Lal_00011051 [Lupinus albus]|uniref:Uncharacterized protein n=1 Tax=Lupinus albus TaxID=3870 RepID=A0A6A4PTD9_LUPAL|nr:putative protein kinase RLK-Pelle-LRR-VI-2 family [Lupinus albus]KAF1892584.1 hypothetical protein Lal_00011051 [Lupinus albus]
MTKSSSYDTFSSSFNPTLFKVRFFQQKLNLGRASFPFTLIYNNKMKSRNWKFNCFSVQKGFLYLLALCVLFQSFGLCCSLNEEGKALLKLKQRIVSDPFGALSNWVDDEVTFDPCNWFGVECSDGKVVVLILKNLCLGGSLAPELANLVNIKSIILRNNSFVGIIPAGIAHLKELEVLDLGYNNFSEPLPNDLGSNISFTTLLLDNNDHLGGFSPEINKLKVHSECQVDKNNLISIDKMPACTGQSRKRHIGQNKKAHRSLRQTRIQEHEDIHNHARDFPDTLALSRAPYRDHRLTEPPLVPKLASPERSVSGSPSPLLMPRSNFPDTRALSPSPSLHPHIAEPPLVPKPASPERSVSDSPSPLLMPRSNFPDTRALSPSPSLHPHIAKPPLVPKSASPERSVSDTPSPQLMPGSNFSDTPTLSPSPSVDPPLPESPLVPNPHSPEPSVSGSSPLRIPGSPTYSSLTDNYVTILAAVGAGVLFLLLSSIGIYLCKTNKVSVNPWATGLSGQLQKAFVTGVPKLKRSELEAACEDFSNVLGTSSICTVYKGTLSSGVEIAVASVSVESSKNWSNTSEVQFRKKIETLSKINHKNFMNLLGYCIEDEPFTRMVVFEYAPNGTLFEHLHIQESENLDWGTRLRIAMGMAYCLQYMHQLDPPLPHSNLNSSAVQLTDDYASKISDLSFLNEIGKPNKKSSAKKQIEMTLASNVYSFGVILFEMVTGKHSYSEDNNGPLDDWASHYLQGNMPIKEMVDPTLANVDEEMLEQVGALIKCCVQHDTHKRPTMKEVSLRLREITNITPKAAVPKLSPLWWAELEIASADEI